MPAQGPAGGTRPERADAARNRLRILEAARTLFAQRSIGEVSLEEVARAAGVGKATLFRRFRDRGARLRTGAYALWHRHVSWLLGQLRPGDATDLLAHLLLAAFDAELLTALRDQGGTQQSVRDAVGLLASALIAHRGASVVD